VSEYFSRAISSRIESPGDPHSSVRPREQHDENIALSSSAERTLALAAFTSIADPTEDVDLPSGVESYWKLLSSTGWKVERLRQD